MKTIRIYLLALILACMAGCSYDPSDVLEERDSNVLDPSKGLDSQGKTALVYGRVSAISDGSAIEGATITVFSDPSYSARQDCGTGISDANGMYGVRFNVDALASDLYLDAIFGAANLMGFPVADEIHEGGVVRKDVSLSP